MASVLVVDDNPDLCRGLVRLLKRLGHAAESVQGGMEALERLGKSPLPDLLILDVMMPDMDGTEVLRRLRADPATATLPVAVFSAVTDPAFVDHVKGLGADDYWLKASFDYSELGSRLSRLLPAG